ncbi:myosin regulatory light chain 2-like [Galendromus occidentalis]|uniref:Myosin regulatory light chain 2-like n=1 Tax=Galendromus occidentalis TaxID=34638 RepID=A0AAJ7WHY1_9ACAR|nr:myosin regulatory light chain 2-like [Galendromus occidentalis]
MFTQNQIAEFKEIFGFVDQDKDGILSKSDLRATFEQLGKISSDQELDDMIKEAGGPINFTQFLQIFGNKVAGMDEEEVIYNAFTVFDEGDGLCEEGKLRKMLTTFGERLTEKEATDVFNEAPMNKEGKIDLKKWANLLTKGVEDENQ